MKFNCDSKDIICITYPSGGFGTFIYQILIYFTKETIKPSFYTPFIFSKNGNSHSMPKLTNVYFHNNKYDPLIFVEYKKKKIPVLCDNGITNSGVDKIKETFPKATLVRVTFGEISKPVLYQTLTIKAQKTSLLESISSQIKNHWPDAHENYAIRENFTLLYHNWPFDWPEVSDTINISLENLVADCYGTLLNLFHQLNLTITDNQKLQQTIKNWYLENYRYFCIVDKSKKVLDSIELNINENLEDIMDLHEQGYINYLIEKKYKITIPVFDYKDWFKDTNEIIKMLRNINGR